MTSNDDLIQNVYAYFLDAYKRGTNATDDGEVVAFESIGFTPGCSSLTGNNVAAAALEEISHIADVLPTIDGGVYERTLRTLSVTYGILLDASQASNAASLITFADLKSQAQEAYKATLGSYDGPTSFHPAYPTPNDWYDLSNESNWATYTYGTTPAAVSPPPVAPVAPGVHVQWHVLPDGVRFEHLAPAQLETIAISPRPFLFGHSTSPATMATVATAAAMPAFTRLAPSSIEATALPVTRTLPIRSLALSSMAVLATKTAAQPLEAPSFTMSFEYCLVRLRRPWLCGDLLATPGWYVPGASSGDYASGAPPNEGPLAILPTAFIAVKNLVIDAAWSENDATAGAKAAAFGPFSLLGGAMDGKNSMRNPGLQIIAWICAPQPQLPPDPDTTSVTQTAPPISNDAQGANQS